ncbi:zinc-ribbon domain-containing protein [Streptomyces sp. NPDC048212]|uniref:zinc-ribbon domain-containing protein n=1 Tax=Streptomyces sp. NPDC048212 TaxID=3156658 RepID=UPI002277083D|nr:zinc-ribbon domain-containing protein [Streptomyces sp. SL203]MCY1649318.1 zinc-ribbon domain-containing protein [Streptomyces sp. SL203]
MVRSLGVSLAEAYPQVAVMWLQERNGGLTPAKATPKMQVAVWWRCAAGHEWEENISNRTALPKWKGGDVAACRECVGYKVSYSYPDCGHTSMITPEAAAKKRGRCWKCQQEWWQANEKRLKKELSTAAKAAAGRAGKLLDAVPLPSDVPAPLATEWRWWATKHLQGAIAVEEQIGREGRTEEMLARVTEMAARLLPTKEDAGRAAAQSGVLRLLDQAHWAEGWLHQLTGRAARRVCKDDLENMAWLLGELLAAWSQRAAEAVAADRAKGYGPPATTEVTRVLTKVVLTLKDELVRDSPLAPYSRAYKELRLPLVPNGKGRYGRADVVVWIPGGPNIVIEIDSAPNPASVEKLIFARDAGAFPLWVRFGKGGIEEIDGVMVVDIRDAVRGVCEAGS